MLAQDTQQRADTRLGRAECCRPLPASPSALAELKLCSQGRGGEGLPSAGRVQAIWRESCSPAAPRPGRGDEVLSSCHQKDRVHLGAGLCPSALHSPVPVGACVQSRKKDDFRGTH